MRLWNAPLPVWTFLLGAMVSAVVFYCTKDMSIDYRPSIAQAEKGEQEQGHSYSPPTLDADNAAHGEEEENPEQNIRGTLGIELDSSLQYAGEKGSRRSAGSAAAALLDSETEAHQVFPRVYWALVLGAFASSIVWMDLIANEAVALMECLGVMLGISTEILGLTVLALGNSVGDLIADTSVARNGETRMAISTCFGSPLLNDMLGLGIALCVTCARTFPKQFKGSVNISLDVAWGFLGGGLLMSLVVFHVYDYKPPVKYAYVLFAFYLVFIVTQVVMQTT